MSKSDKYNLVEGGILNKLFLVALPIIGTQIIQMTYNLTDMFWLGRLGSDYVAASGTVGLFMWMSVAFALFGRMGAEIGVSQNFGRGDKETARKFAQNSVLTGIVLGMLVALVYVIGNKPLIGFFGIREANVEKAARDYLSLVAVGIPFTFVTSAVTGIFNGSGNSRITLLINGAGLVLNMILDPLMIFTFGLGIHGAAIATVIAQVTASCLSVVALKRAQNRPFERVKLVSRPQKDVQKQIFKWVVPISVESFLFTFLTMLVTSIIATYSADAMAASRIGSQVESLTWLITGGFASALTAFVGQNFGAGKWGRIDRCVKISSGMMLVWGAVVSVILYFGAGILFKIFLPNDPGVVEIGVGYLHILALSQIPGCLEGVASGAFKGRGRTIPPSIASGATNALRVVLAYVLAFRTPLGLTGVWVALTIGAAARGLWMYVWYLVDSRKVPKEDAA